jgi:hypothetical protein
VRVLPVVIRRLRSSLVLWCGTLAFCGGCDRGGPTAPPDLGSPLITVAFPASGAYDRDGDGLVELEVAFADSLSGVDPATITVTSDPAVPGLALAAVNLLDHWQVTRRDSLGLVAEETLAALLPRGRVTLTIEVRDRAGNRAERTVTLDLPVAARHTIIDLQATVFLTSQLVVAPDGQRLYVTTEEPDGTALSIVDAQGLRWLKTVRTEIRGGSRIGLDPARQRLYAMSIDEPLLLVFDLASESFLPPIDTRARGAGVTISARRREAYVGLEVEDLISGFISVIDLDRGIENRVINLGIGNDINPGDQMGMNTLVLNEAETQLFAVTNKFAIEGILVVDPVAGELLGQLDLWPEHGLLLGFASDAIIHQGQLYAASSSSQGQGRVGVTSLMALGQWRFGNTGPTVDPIELAMAPDGRELLLSGAGHSFDAVQLMDATTLEVIWEERFFPPAEIRQGIGFRPDGRVFFTAGAANNPAPNELFVYLRRP